MNQFKRLLFIMLLLSVAITGYAQKQKVWIDADTGNETDDIYAIARLLNDPKVDVVGVSSAHFNNADLVTFKKWNQYDTKGINTVQISQDLNIALLKAMGKLNIAHPLGADRQMGRAWGGREPRDSEAARGIISAVKNLGATEHLDVICLGALTNIASAIALDSTISPKIICHALGASYDLKGAFWNKSEFNIRNDLNAFDYLLDQPKVNLIMMTLNTASVFRFERDELYQRLSSTDPVQEMLKKRWEETNPDDKIRTLWDLALIEAYLKPEFTETKEVATPPENTHRIIKIYSSIKAAELKADFYLMVKKP